MNELRLACRQLLKNPSFTAVAVLTLGLGIGANTAMFSLLHALLFRPLPYPDSERLVRVFRTSPQSQNWPHSPANFLDRRAQNNVFSSSTAFSWWSFNLAETGQPTERIEGVVASGDYFKTLATPPVLGRVFGPDDDEPGLNRVAVISHRFWQRRFAGDTNVLGQTIRLDGESVTVIGVMPQNFGHRLWSSVDLWKPIGWTAEQRASRGNNWLNELARLKPGVSLSQAQVEMNALAARLAEEYPAYNAEIGVRVVSLLASATDESVQRMVWLSFGLTLLVLLIACANLANLQLARLTARSRDLAVRAALGASRGRLVRQMLVECLLLSLGGAALGLMLAAICNHLLNGQLGMLAPASGFAVRLDVRVLCFSGLCAGLTVLIFGTIPAWLTSRVPPNEALKQSSRGATIGRAQQRFQQTLVVGEIALALALLSGAGLFLSGLQRFAARDPGWHLDDMLTAQIALLSPAYEDKSKRQSVISQLEEGLAALPGVQHVGFSSMLPLWGFGSRDFEVEGQPARQPLPLMFYESVNRGYFGALGLQVREGRLFDSSDTTNHPAVVVINESMARHFWPGQSALGKRLGSGDPKDPRWETVVGVVNDIRFPASFEPPDTLFQAYRPMTQLSQRWLNVMLRVAGPVQPVTAALRGVVAKVDPELSAAEIKTVRERLDQHFANPTLLSRLLAAFAGLGLLLTAIGIYGVLSCSVAQRTTELGLRMALGATRSQIHSLVLKQGLKLGLVGLALGLGGASAIPWLLANVAPEFPSRDPLILVLVTGFLLTTAVVACWLPARRAAKADPMAALRSE